MFQPRGPYFFLYWITAWKNESEYISFLKAFSQSEPSKYSSLFIGSERYETVKLFLSPFAGSFVIFNDFCNTDWGKSFVG